MTNQILHKKRFNSLMDPKFWSKCQDWRVDDSLLADVFLSSDYNDQNDYGLKKELDKILYQNRQVGGVSGYQEAANFLQYLFLVDDKDTLSNVITYDGSSNTLSVKTGQNEHILASFWEWLIALAATPDNSFGWNAMHHWFSGPLKRGYYEVSFPKSDTAQAIVSNPASLSSKYKDHIETFVLDFWEIEGFLSPDRFLKRPQHAQGFSLIDGVLSLAPKFGSDVIDKPYWRSWWNTAPLSARSKFLQSVLTTPTPLDKQRLLFALCQPQNISKESVLDMWRHFFTHHETQSLLRKRHLWKSLISCLQGSALGVGVGFHELAHSVILPENFSNLVLGGALSKITQWSKFLNDDAWSVKVFKNINNGVTQDLAESLGEAMRFSSYSGITSDQAFDKLKTWIAQLKEQNFLPKTLNVEKYAELIGEAIAKGRQRPEEFIGPAEAYLQSCSILQSVAQEVENKKSTSKKPKRM